MPEITWFGWFHTIVAMIGILFGVFSLTVHKVITAENRSGIIYLLCTFIAAATALMIYRHGGFGPAHGLAVLTLLALAGGFLVTQIPVFSNIAHYLQAFCFSGTLLFHMLPAVTDGLLRLPVDKPILSTPEDPLLLKLYLLLLVIFIVGFSAQFLWLKANAVKQYPTAARAAVSSK
ncbi:MAG: hypothetical protein AAF438_00125 [Pseudomonadota bacterium]